MSTTKHRHAVEALTSGDHDNFALFSYFIDGSPGAAIVAVNRARRPKRAARRNTTCGPLREPHAADDDHRPRRSGGMSGVPPLRRRPNLAVPSECRNLIDRGALVAIIHGGGKDSQCMTILLSCVIPVQQLLVVHAPLGEVQWPGTIEHIESTTPTRSSWSLGSWETGA